MKIDGYMITAELEDNVLTVHPANKVARAALVGQDSADGNDAVIPLASIVGTTFKDASRLTNGNLTVRTDGGKKYQLHFRRKHSADFTRLADLLPARAAS